jgi:GntR family transcriptional repressor for pyruvate dehydrogenase complex
MTRRLIDYIRTEGLAVGDRLPSIRQLAAEFEVSPNVVRDALVQAQTLGLVKIHPRSGAFVQSLTYAPLVDALANTFETALMQVDHSLFHVLDARRCLETELAGQAAARRRLEDLLPLREALEGMRKSDSRLECVDHDIRFHLCIAQIAGNPVLVTILRSLLDLLRPYLNAVPWTPETRNRNDRLHVEIYQALLDGDAERARACLNGHVGAARESLLGVVKTPGAEIGRVTATV